MKLRLSLLALTTALLISTTAFAQEPLLDPIKQCADWKAQTSPAEGAKSHCLGVVAQRTNRAEARIAVAVMGKLLDDLSVQVTPLKMVQAANGQWTQNVAGQTSTSKISPSRGHQLEQVSAMTIHFLADADANAVSIKWLFASGFDVEGKSIEHDTTIIVRLADEPTSNVTTITPAK